MPLKIPTAAAMIVFAASIAAAQEPPPRKPPAQQPNEPPMLAPRVGDKLNGPGLGNELALPSRPAGQKKPEKKDRSKQ